MSNPLPFSLTAQNTSKLRLTELTSDFRRIVTEIGMPSNDLSRAEAASLVVFELLSAFSSDCPS
jgi:hypothetical protein